MGAVRVRISRGVPTILPGSAYRHPVAAVVGLSLGFLLIPLGIALELAAGYWVDALGVVYVAFLVFLAGTVLVAIGYSAALRCADRVAHFAGTVVGGVLGAGALGLGLRMMWFSGGALTSLVAYELQGLGLVVLAICLSDV